jgi:hypothetical protein
MPFPQASNLRAQAALALPRAQRSVSDFPEKNICFASRPLETLFPL